MLQLPVPFVSAVLCLVVAVVLSRLDLGRRAARVIFVSLLLLFAVETILVAFRFGYGFTSLTTLQRMLPLYNGPLMYLGFVALAASSKSLRKQMILHLGLPTLINGIFLLMPANLSGFDMAISMSYLIYLVLLLLLWRKGPDRLIHARLDIAPHIHRWMLSAAGVLVVFLLMDTAIALSFAFNNSARATALITSGTVVMTALLVVMLASLPTLMAARSPRPEPPPVAPASDDAKVEAEARSLLEKTQLYLDPELSVQRLARRMHVPERTLSTAINQSQGMNISQYVNSFRLAHAAHLLRETRAPVTEVMTQSGFLTRSNFYREFQRVYGQSPAKFRKGS